MHRHLHSGVKSALAGLFETLLFEWSFRVMAIVAIAVVIAMFYFPTTRLERGILLVTLFSVLILELINSTVERIMDFVQPRQDEEVRIIKDLSAAIVLLASLGAAVVGAVIFWPYVLG